VTLNLNDEDDDELFYNHRAYSVSFKDLHNTMVCGGPVTDVGTIISPVQVHPQPCLVSLEVSDPVLQASH